MTLTSKLTGTAKSDKEFKSLLVSVKPNKEDYYTLSGSIPFSDEYSILAPTCSSVITDSSLVGVAFDYLARFRIAQFLKRDDVVMGMVALSGFEKLKGTPEYVQKDLRTEPYASWLTEIRTFTKDASISIFSLIEIAVHLAKLEQIVRYSVKKADINVEYLLYEPAPMEVKRDLENLMTIFEEKFMIPEIINKKSKVVFNPNFGVSSALVSGADADIFIDGTLYDFKSSQDQKLKTNDNLQMIGYYLLNELAIATMSEDYGFYYIYMGIKRLAFYKGRFGEVEYYDVEKHLPYTDVRPKLQELAEYFKNNQGKLHNAIYADIKSIKEILEEIRTGVM